MIENLTFPVQIVFQKMHPSQAVQDDIKERASKLSRYCNRIMNCHVLVEIVNRHHHQGNLFHVCIDLHVPNMKLVVSRCTTENHAHEDIYVALRDAFCALKRKLQNFTLKQKGKKKHHDVAPHGRIVQILPAANHGFIESSDGRSLYFTNNSVVDGSFDKMAIGDEVRFVETFNQKGTARASTVKLIRKHHLVA
jgi:ribosomal subunit interface protein